MIFMCIQQPNVHLKKSFLASVLCLPKLYSTLYNISTLYFISSTFHSISDIVNITHSSLLTSLQILIKDRKAVGISFVRENKKHVIMAKKEVLLSAGTISSPQILMISGIGPKNHLKSLGVWKMNLSDTTI